MAPRNTHDELGSADTLAAVGELTTPYDHPEAPTSLIGEVIADRYRVLRLLGSGGMGSVYMARDHELDDIVALKTIRSASDQALNRIRREVKLARRVTHRNVARTFALGEHSGGRFLTMEYIDGEPLSAMVRRHGRLPLPRAIAIVRAVCSGLSAAHDAGVVHRDIKPDNVMIARDGRVVVTDFGIAVGGGGLGSASLVPSGTPAYMSPEQIESGDVTVASDVYSTGVLAFQLFTGELPWTQDADTSMSLARLSQSPKDPRSIYPELNPAVAEVVMRSLHKQPHKRFATIGALGVALARAAPAEVLTDRPITPSTKTDTPDSQKIPRRIRRKLSVAVLPFANRGADEDAFLVDGFVEELIDTLCGVRELRVMSRGALAKLDASALEPHEVGATLGVDVVIGGSLGRMAEQLRVKVRAIQVEDQVQLWADKFTVAPQELLTIPDSLVAGLSEALELDAESNRRDAMTSADAMELYLRARHEYHNPAIGLASLKLFEQAHELDSDNAMINAGLAMALVRRWFLSDTDTERLVERARDHAERALAAAPALGEPHMAIAQLNFNLGDNAGAAREVRTAIAKSPSCVEAHELMGRMLLEMGRIDEGKRRFEVAIELGHNRELLEGQLMRTYALEGDWQRVDDAATRVDIGRVMGRLMPVRINSYRRDLDALRRHAQKLEGLESDDAGALLLAKLMLPIYLGEAPASSAYVMIQPDHRESSSKRRLAYGFQLRAEVAGFVGDDDIVMQSLQVATNNGMFDLHWLDHCSLLDDVRDRDEFVSLRDRVAERCHSMYDAMWS